MEGNYSYTLQKLNWTRRSSADINPTSKERKEAGDKQDKEPCPFKVPSEARGVHKGIYNDSEKTQFRVTKSGEITINK